MKHAGVVASPISNTKHPALLTPANTATLKAPPEILGSLPTDTLTRRPVSNPSITHSAKLSAIASTAAAVKSTALPFSPSIATPLTSDPFCSRRILPISSSSSVANAPPCSAVLHVDLTVAATPRGATRCRKEKLITLEFKSPFEIKFENESPLVGIEVLNVADAIVELWEIERKERLLKDIERKRNLFCFCWE